MTFELWDTYGDVEKIAAIRKLTKQTVLGHLIKYIAKGEVNIKDLISIDRLEDIKSKHAGKEPFDTLTDMKNYLNHEFEYGDLKLYQAWISRESKKGNERQRDE